jgi:hypothetical protein
MDWAATLIFCVSGSVLVSCLGYCDGSGHSTSNSIEVKGNHAAIVNRTSGFSAAVAKIRGNIIYALNVLVRTLRVVKVMGKYRRSPLKRDLPVVAGHRFIGLIQQPVDLPLYTLSWHSAENDKGS